MKAKRASRRTGSTLIAMLVALLFSPVYTRWIATFQSPAIGEPGRNVLVGEVVSEVVRPGNKGHFVVRILKILKDGKLFRAGQRLFSFPKTTGWDTFHFKPGEVLLFTFPKRLTVLCNHPIRLK